jgi:hypothetical protein
MPEPQLSGNTGVHVNRPLTNISQSGNESFAVSFETFASEKMCCRLTGLATLAGSIKRIRTSDHNACLADGASQRRKINVTIKTSTNNGKALENEPAIQTRASRDMRFHAPTASSVGSTNSDSKSISITPAVLLEGSPSG